MSHIVDKYPLSPIQQGILFHSLYSPESGVYMVQTHCVLQPSPDVSAFERAWNEVVRRHDIFRTAFEWKEVDDAVQVLYDQADISLTQLDWRGQSTAKQRERLQEYLMTERMRGFDFSVPPLMRLALIKLDDESSQFIWTVHHLLIDTWSEVLLFAEASSFYHAFSQGRTAQTEPAPSYRDYVKWFQQQDLSEADAFWRQLLQGFEAPTPLGTARTSRSETGETYESQEISLSIETTIALQALARKHEVTLNTLTQGAWALLLSRYSGESDVVFGMTVSGRPFSLAGAEFIIGPFLNTLPLRVQLRPDVTLPAWLRELQARSTDLRQFEYSPLVRVQGLSQVQGGVPLFESIYVFQSAPVNPLQKEKESTNGRLAIRDVQTVQNSNYPLCVIVSPARQLSLEIIYDVSVFDDGAIARRLEHLRNLLESMTLRPTGRLFDLPLLSATERRELLHDWNKTERSLATGSVGELFREQAERTPDALAVADNEQQLTYGELEWRANQLAHHLIDVGVCAEDRVGILLERSAVMVVALLGVLKAGGCYVPLDPQYPQERLAFMSADAGLKVLLTTRPLAESLHLEESGMRLLLVDEWEWDGDSELETGNDPGVEVNEHQLAYLIYTSGSTGQPKGVAIEHASATTFIHWAGEIFDQQALGGVLFSTSICFDLSIFELFVTLSHGGQIILADNALQLPELQDGAEVTLINTVPSAMAALVRTRAVPDSVRVVNLAGEPLSEELVAEIYATTQVEKVYNLYGPTEDTTYSTYTLVSSGEWVTIGRPVANTRVYVLDEHWQPVPVGVVGELYLGGSGLARGYWRRPELTAEKFIPDSLSGEKGKRLYRTGDKVRYLANGKLEFLGRADHQMKLRGYRIELGEIESVLRRNDQVREAIVVVQEPAGGEKQLVAYVVADDSVKVSGLRKWLKERLPEYMIPAALVLMQELPLTPNGKVDRRALIKTNLHEVGPAESFIAPRNQTEMILAAIWAEVLHCKNVGANANFFDLGGHSLLAMRLASKLRESFKIDLSLRTIFAAATLTEMAREVDAALRQDAAVEMSPIHRRSLERQAPLSFAQQRLWLIQQLEPESTAYNVSNAVRLRGPLNVGALEKALNEIVRRHEILRTTFTLSGDQLVQVVAPPAALNLQVEDLRTMSAGEQEAEARQIAKQEAEVVFDLERGPLFRVRLLRLNDEHVLTICRHHIIFDGWSHEVFTTELVALYAALDKGQASLLPELPIQYADFACWERDWLRDDKMETLLSYWKRQLDGAPAALNLPVDWPMSGASSFESRWQFFTLDKDQTRAIRTLSQAERVTVYMVLLAAFKTLLYRYSGQADFLIGTPVTSRLHAETEPLIGCFLNMLVLRTDLSGNPTFRELLRRVRETVLGAYTHQEMPFDRLVEELKIGRAQTSTPLVQVVFSHVKPLQAPPKLANLEAIPLNVEVETGKADWLMLMVERGEEIISSLQYRIDLFDDETMSRTMRHFENLFRSILQNPDARLDELTMLSDEEQIVLNQEIDVTALSRSFSF
ncbi:MAG: amino acid adenylation domain-containing protein [Acidobacteriota bacterium]